MNIKDFNKRMMLPKRLNDFRRCKHCRCKYDLSQLIPAGNHEYVCKHCLQATINMPLIPALMRMVKYEN